MLIKPILFIALIFLPQLASSQIYKCINSNGKTTYSEESCISSIKGSELYLEPNVIESSALRDRIARENTYKTTVTKQSITTSNSEDSNDMMSDYDKKTRLRSLQIDMASNGGTYEEKVDARNEHRYLSKNSVRNLSYDDDVSRRNLKIDLGSSDHSKRSKAMNLLNALYATY